jgi:hypothetical protein
MSLWMPFCLSFGLQFLGYNIVLDERRGDKGLVEPLTIECSNCGSISEFFDTRKHGYDGEQGINTHIIGKGESERFGCPKCGVTPMMICANFHYQEIENLGTEMLKRPEDFFDGIDIVGQCLQCDALIEITSFECA